MRAHASIRTNLQPRAGKRAWPCDHKHKLIDSPIASCGSKARASFKLLGTEMRQDLTVDANAATAFQKPTKAAIATRLLV